VWNMKFHVEQEQGGDVSVEHEVPSAIKTEILPETSSKLEDDL
jgi:hypothetical protein